MGMWLSLTPIYGADIRLRFPYDHFVSGEPALDYRPSSLD